MNKLIIFFLLMFLSLEIISQDMTIGVNSTISYNKFMGGILFTTWKSENDRKTYPNWVFRVSSGIVGYKKFEPDKSRITITENSAKADGVGDLPSGVFLAKSPNDNYKGYYYNSSEKFVLVGLDLSVIKQFKVVNGFYFGVGSGWNTSKNNGDVIWYNPIANDTRTENSLLGGFSTFYLLSNFGFSTSLTKKVILNASIQLNYHFPNNANAFASFPNVGVEQDMSISINYLLN